MLELIGELFLRSMVSGLVTNQMNAGIGRAVVGARNQIWRPTPENHDLQRTLLGALRDGLETTTRRGLKSLSGPEKRQVDQWLGRQIQAINQEIAAVQRGEGSSLGTQGDWAVLLRSSPEELEAMSQRQSNGQLRQLKAALEEQFQVDTLPPSFREEFKAEWLPWVNLYLAEAIKTNPRVAEMLEVNLLLEIQSGVQQLTEALSNPQKFLGSVQPIDFDVEEVRAELVDWQKELTGQIGDLQGQIGAGFEDTQRQVEDMNQQVQQRFDQVLAVLLQGADPNLPSTATLQPPLFPQQTAQRQQEAAERQRQAEADAQRQWEAAERQRQAEADAQRQREAVERQRQAEAQRQREAAQDDLRSEKGIDYTRLRDLLKAGKWSDADNETYEVMIRAVGKKTGQWFTRDELLNFPCTDLRTIDGLWVKYSQGKFGFSVQKKIYVECGAKLDGKYPGDKIWCKFCDRVGWRKGVNYKDLKTNPSFSPAGEFPFRCGCGLGWLGLFSRTETCKL